VFKKQFLFTKEKFPLIEGFLQDSIGGFNLQYHKDCVFTKASNASSKVILIGELFSYKKPELTNKEIIKELIKNEHLDRFQNEISEYYGQYIIIYKSEIDFSIFNDACGQSEIYYTEDFENFGSQIKLLQQFLNLSGIINPNGANYYNSKEFKKLRLFINDTTPYEGVKKLMPNHHISINEIRISRFHGLLSLTNQNLDKVAIKAANMLKGYIKAISLRYKLCLPITAGYDSRVLFLASLDLDCDYFVTKFKNMPDNHNDLVISKQLAAIYNKPFKIVEDVEMQPEDFEVSYEASLDFPLFLSPDLVGDKVIINGNISEIARNGFYYCINPSARNLNVINFFKLHPFIISEYNKWLTKYKRVFKKTKGHILDLFLWEQFMGVVHAKAKSQNKQLGVNVMSPYNSRVLLNTMLSVNRSKRDRMDNALYNKIIAYLSNNNETVIDLPINPSKNKKRYLLLKKIGMHKMYWTLKIKLESK